MEPKLFDTKAEFEIPIVSGGIKRCLVRWPTDEEWCARARAQSVVRRNLGRDQVQTQALHVIEANADLFGKIRLAAADSPEPSFDSAEASAVIERLERCEVVSITRQGNEFQFEASVPGGRVAHVLKMPSQQDMVNYNRSCVVVAERRRAQEIRYLIEPGGALYDRLQVKAVGYSNGVPIIHKDAIVRELLIEVSRVAEEADPEV